ncbi:MAG: FAD-dependent oxidoreductase [bacterium]|nr:FAD-dependent oxidoreductase [bacterium]
MDTKMKKIFLLVLLLATTCNYSWAAQKSVVESDQSSAYDTIIIGGGIAGLSSAYYLKNKSIILLEKENRVGGRTISGSHEGFTYAKGTEYLGEPEDYLARLIADLGLNLVEIPEPMDGRYYAGNFYIGYDRMEDMLVHYSSQAEFNRFVQLLNSLYNSGYTEIPELNLNSQLAALDTISARQWFRDNNFSAIYQEVYNVSSRGLFGASIDEISALSFIPEMAYDYIDDDQIRRQWLQGKSGRKNFSRRRRRIQAAESSGAFTFVTGITEVTDALAADLGNKIQLNATVTGVTLQNGLYNVSYTNGSGSAVTLYAKTVILAVPALIALQLASGILSTEQKSIMQQVSYAPYISVALFSDEPIFNQAFDLAVPDNLFFTDVYDSTWVQRAYDGSLTNKAKYIANIYIAAQSYRDETLLQLSDNDILTQIFSDLNGIFPGAEQKVTGTDIYRFPYAYPVMTNGAYTRLTRLHEITTGNVQLAGDYMIYPTFEAAVETGYLAGEKIKDRLNDTFTNPRLSGAVTENGNPLQGVTMTFSFNGHTETTNSSGNYGYIVPYGTTTTVTPYKSGYGFSPASTGVSLLTANRSNVDFAADDAVVSLTLPVDGASVSGTVIAAAQANVAGVTKVEFYIDGNRVKTDSRSPYRYRWETVQTANGSHIVKATAYNSSGSIGSAQSSVTVSNSTNPPQIVFDHERLNFTSIINGGVTGSQEFLVSDAGGGILEWTAAGSANWLSVSPTGGSGNGRVTVSIDGTGLDAGVYTGSVIITDADAGNSPASLPVYLTVKTNSQDQPPTGNFETPLDNSTVAGSVPVTGWAVDDTGIASVKIYRDAVTGEAPGLVYIGDALFIDGARPDIEALYPANPFNYRAGWGYMMLSNFLPNGGNGNFVLTAVATDTTGNSVTLGSQRITVNNAGDPNPFGAIDTPGQGGEASAAEFANAGWVLTPPPNTVANNGSTIFAWVDGVQLEGNPQYNIGRPDIAGLFPGYNNAAGAGGRYFLDTTLYADGVHTIAWTVTDNGGNSAGIGSRYFKILNTGNSRLIGNSIPYGYREAPSLRGGNSPYLGGDTSSYLAGETSSYLGGGTAPSLLSENYPFPPVAVPGDGVSLERGYRGGCEEMIKTDINGSFTIRIKEGRRIKIRLKKQSGEISHHTLRHMGKNPSRFSAGLLYEGKLKMLPVGSYLDEREGIFYWQPGAGFIGEYVLIFFETNTSGKIWKREATIFIEPKFPH